MADLYVPTVKHPNPANVGTASITTGSGNPTGTTALPGTVYYDTVGSTFYYTADGTTWTAIAGGGGGTTTTLNGTGSPEGAITGSPGWTYLQTDTGSFWVKKTGTATNTGWLELIV